MFVNRLSTQANRSVLVMAVKNAQCAPAKQLTEVRLETDVCLSNLEKKKEMKKHDNCILQWLSIRKITTASKKYFKKKSNF